MSSSNTTTVTCARQCSNKDTSAQVQIAPSTGKEYSPFPVHSSTQWNTQFVGLSEAPGSPLMKAGWKAGKQKSFTCPAYSAGFL